MKRILQDDNTYVISGRKGEEIMTGIKEFCEEHKIDAAFFHAIGAVGEVEIAWYDLEAKEYVTSLIQEDLELVSLTGNVSKLGKEMIIHNHGVFSNRAMETKGGHVNKAVISGACEIVLNRIEGNIGRAYDDETGLNLMA
tara:strand:- start:927 stop:1346 length:420 start_codon:yes stop_codon:yes gene_type:complete